VGDGTETFRPCITALIEKIKKVRVGKRLVKTDFFPPIFFSGQNVVDHFLFLQYTTYTKHGIRILSSSKRTESNRSFIMQGYFCSKQF